MRTTYEAGTRVVLAVIMFCGLMLATTASAEIVQLAASGSHTVALMADGTVQAWGWNAYGQLGTGTQNIRNSNPVTVAGLYGKATAVAAGHFHTVVLMEDGTVKTWGYNSKGQLGTSAEVKSLTPLAVDGLDGKVTAIAAGHLHTLALMADGTVKSWGCNSDDQLGEGRPSTCSKPINVPGFDGKVTAIAAGHAHSVALMADGTLRTWGWNGYGQLGDGTHDDSSLPVKVANLDGEVIAIAAGDYHNLALMADGTVKAWGRNNHLQLGNTLTTHGEKPLTVPGLDGKVIAIAAGHYHSAALSSDGRLKTWGWNGYGQLGGATPRNSSTPIAVDGLKQKVAVIAAGGNHTIALLSDKTIVGWGWNWAGQLANDVNQKHVSPYIITSIK